MSTNHIPITWSDAQQADTKRRTCIEEILKSNYVGPVRALQASLNEFCHWSADEVTALFCEFPPLPGRVLYPMGPESRYPPTGGKRWIEAAGAVALLGVVDVLAVATSPFILLRSSQQRKEAVSAVVEANKLIVSSQLFVSASLDLMEKAGKCNQALCVNKWGQFKILSSGYAAVSHVWAETMGFEYHNEKLEQNGRGILMTHFNKIMGKALQCGYEWVWFDLLAIPKRSTHGTNDARFTQTKTLIINSLHSIYRNAAAVIILDSFTLHLPSGDALKIAPLLVCGMWLTRIWTYQEVKLARKALIVTATHVVDLQDILDVVALQKFLEPQKWSEIHKTIARLQPIKDQGINLADIALSCTNRNTENETDHARGFFALLGLQWQAGWIYEDGIQHIYKSRPQEAAMLASMHSPRGLSKPFSWAPKYLAHQQGKTHAAHELSFADNGLTGSWYTATVQRLVHVASYGYAKTSSGEDKLAFQLLVNNGSGASVMVTVVTWSSEWTLASRRWVDAIPGGNTRLLCPTNFDGQFPFPVVLLSIQTTNIAVAEVIDSALLVNGLIETPQVQWLLT
ncbi:hypothetical protein N0V95_009149 [Ascochyta clinopodiicola]|nr:hypothetical protein N0V95_009149 [Ascochyta clinopodiicola]